MPSKNDAWGIEVGANAIKAMRVIRDGDRLSVADYEVLPFKKILTTPDLDVDEAIQVGLDQLMNKHEMKKSAIVASVPGHMAFARFAKLPPVDPKKVAEIVRFEAVQQIPFPLEQVEWDYQVFQEADSPEVEVGIFAITKDRVMKFLADYQAVNLRIDALTLSPLGVYNGLAYDLDLDENAPGTILVDIGTSSTDVVIVEGGRLWLRTLPIGGNNFTEALVKTFKVTFPRAEKYKKEAATSKHAKQLFQAMRPVFADLVQEIQRSLGYYQSLNKDAELVRLVGVGSTFRLPGLTKFLKQQLQIEVKRLDGFKKLSIEGKRESELSSNSLNLATVYGLALQGLGWEEVTANILPSHIIAERMWKSKQPWFAGAAAVLVAAAGVSWYSLQNAKAAQAEAAASVQPVVRSAVNDGKKYKQAYMDMTGGNDPRTRVNNYLRIADYRDLWPKMLEDFSYALKAIDPQDPLVDPVPDYDEIKQIARTDRNRLYIESYKVEFWEDGEDPAKATKKTTRGRNDEEEVVESDTEEAPLPKIKVTVTGTVPSRDYNALINKFGDALAQAQKMRNRPYTVVERSFTVIEMPRVGEAGSTRKVDQQEARARAGGEPESALTGPGGSDVPSRGVPRRRSPGGLPPGGFQEFPGGFDGGQGFPQQRRTNRGMKSYAQVLPEQPEVYELWPDDRQFTVEWVVELRKPDEARLFEDPEYVPKPPVEEEGDGSQDAEVDVDSALKPDETTDTEARS